MGYCDTKDLRIHDIERSFLCSLLFSIFLKNSQNNDNVTNNISTTKTFGKT